MFVVLLTYVVSIEGVDKHVTAHRAFLDEYYKAGHFIASGAKIPRTGGVILAKAKSRAELDAILEQDPFKKHGVAKYDVIEFNPTKSAPGFEKFISP